MDWIESPAPELTFSDLAGKTALVTGTASGIGRATAERLLANRTRVFGLDLAAGDLTHPAFTPISCDLSDAAAIERAFSQITSQTTTLDYVVNVAGIDTKHPVDTLSVEQWDRMLDLNLRAYYLVIQRALPLLRSGTGRSIVNVSSINYRLGVPGRAAYSASKAAILGLTTGLSRELGRDGIRVNTVSPGWVFTERQVREYFSGENEARNLDYLRHQQSVRLKITPGDIANHILFYLSTASRASAAHNCVVDAGWILE